MPVHLWRTQDKPHTTLGRGANAHKLTHWHSCVLTAESISTGVRSFRATTLVLLRHNPKHLPFHCSTVCTAHHPPGLPQPSQHLFAQGGASQEHRERLLQTTDKLDAQSRQLEDSKRTVLEIEDTGESCNGGSPLPIDWHHTGLLRQTFTVSWSQMRVHFAEFAAERGGDQSGKPMEGI